MRNYRTIVEQSPDNIAVMDVFSKLIQERIIFIDGVIDDDLANGVIAQMLHLDAEDDTPIDIYINSPGGDVYQGLAIYDVSKIISCPIRTVCVGMAASMAAVLMLMGDDRDGLKHSRIMLHEVSDWIRGKSKDVMVEVEEMRIAQKALYDIISEKTNLENIDKLFTLDTWFSANQALEAGILTKIL